MYQRSESEIERKIKENKHEIKTYDCLDYVVKWAVITTGTVFAILGLNKFYEYATDLGTTPQTPINNGRVVIERKKIKEFVPPAVNMPHMKIGKSTSGMDWDKTNGKFGPFAKQLFVNDQSDSSIARLALEKVNGVYQGACILFREGFGSGNLPLTFDAEEGCAFVGGTNRGWGSKGRKTGALERVNWTGKSPFEVHNIKITKNGFIINFTEEISASNLLDKANLKLDPSPLIHLF